jgi:hypothetical protein
MDFLKVSMARIVSLLEQTLKNIFGEGLSNETVTDATILFDSFTYI